MRNRFLKNEIGFGFFVVFFVYKKIHSLRTVGIRPLRPECSARASMARTRARAATHAEAVQAVQAGQ